jgi:hypothetical protein
MLLQVGGHHLHGAHRQGRHTPLNRSQSSAPLWQRITNVWSRVTSPARGLRRLTSSPTTGPDTYEASRDCTIGSWLAPRCARVSSRRWIKRLNDYSTEAVV